MLYVHGDNNLEAFALSDVEEMYDGFVAARGNTSEYIMIVLLDRCKFSEHPDVCDARRLSDDIRRLSGGSYVAVDSAFSTAKLLRLRSGFWEQIEDWGEVDMDSPVTLTRFMNACFNAVPRRKTVILQLWDHGGGYSGFGGDYGNGNSGMGLTVMKNAIASSLSTNGVAKLDLLGFDACLMASFTVLEVLNPVTKWALASEDLEPGDGWDYRVLNTAAASVQAWAQTMINAFIVHPTPDPSDGPRVLALVDMQRYQQYQTDMIALMEALTQNTLQADELFMKAVSAARARTFGITIWGPAKEVVDIGNLLTNLKEEFAKQQDCGQVFSTLKPLVENAQASYDALISYYRSDRPAREQYKYTGMHIVFPEYSARDQADPWFSLYSRYNWASLPGLKAWNDFLHAHYDTTVTPRRGPNCPTVEVFTNPASNDSLDAPFFIANPDVRIFPDGRDGISVEGTTPDTAVSSYMYFGLTFTGLTSFVYWVGQSPGTLSDGFFPTTSSVSGYWDGYISILIQKRALYDPRPVDPDSDNTYYCTPYFSQELVDTDGDGVVDQEKQTLPLLYFPPASGLTNADLRSGTYDPFQDEESFSATLYVTINYETEEFTWKLFATTAAGTVSEVTKAMGGKLVPLIFSSAEVDTEDFERAWCDTYFVWGEPTSPAQNVGELDMFFRQTFDEELIADLELESVVIDFDIEPVRGNLASVQALMMVNEMGSITEAEVVCENADLCYAGLISDSAPVGMGRWGFLGMLFVSVLFPVLLM
eukprot:jgi/Mesvir1/12090/Mv00366-RA.3